MKITVHPSVLQGEITAPASKSIMQRAVIAALLCPEPTLIANPCFSEDCLALLDAAEALGATVGEHEAGILICGQLKPPKAGLNAGESGLGSRLLIPLLATLSRESVITAQGSLKSRTMKAYLDVLPQHGVAISSGPDGELPWKIQGPLKAGEYELDGSVSSQFLSGLLMVLPTLTGDSVIRVKDLRSKPYIDLTLEILEHYGVSVVHKDHEEFHIPGNQRYEANALFVDGDWSSAAGIMAAAAVASRDAVRIDEVGGVFTQADQRITGALLFAGARIHREENNYLVYPGKLRGIKFDAEDSPDLVPVLAAMAVFAKGPTEITGIARLAHKESNRAQVIQTEFAKAGIRVELEAERMVIHPGKVQSCTIDAHNDHRIAMAAAILGLAGAAIVIEGAECVNKSYPGFWDDLEKLGATLTRSRSK